MCLLERGITICDSLEHNWAIEHMHTHTHTHTQKQNIDSR